MKTNLYRKKPRRRSAFLSPLGLTQLHLRHPWVVTWWSCAFPGFGHLLLSKHIRGFLLIGWELLINTQAGINTALIHSFTGQFDLAKEAMDVRWMGLYAPVYLFAIYDSYRTSVDLNRLYALAEREQAAFSPFKIGALEINYLDKRTPWLAFVWSLLMPGMGQLYTHRIVTSFFVLTGWIVLCYQSRFFEAVQLTLMGQPGMATAVLDAHWVLFLPSIFCFSAYDAYVNAVEGNKLFDKEQRRFLRQHYQSGKDDHVRIISSFDHSMYVELALAALEENGIAKSDILAVPLNNRSEPPRLLDTMHRSDGISLIDTGMVCATASAVVASSVGFVLAWGPIIWGLIGAVAGFAIGLAIDLLFRRKKPSASRKGSGAEVIVLVECAERQAEMVESLLWEHRAFGVAAIKPKSR